MSKLKSQIPLPHHFVQISFTHLSSPTQHPPKHLRFSIFRNIQKLDQTPIITASIRRDDASLKGKLHQPLTFKILLNQKKLEDYFIIFYEVIYSANQNDNLTEQQLGSVKIPLGKVLENWKQKKDENKPQPLRDWLSSDIELFYLVTVHTNQERYYQYARNKKSRRNSLLDNSIMTKIDSKISDFPMNEITESQQLPLVSQIKQSKPFEEEEIKQEQAEHVEQTTPEFDSQICDFNNQEQFISTGGSINQVKKDSPILIGSSTEIFETLGVINQQQEIIDKIERIRIIMNKIPPYKLMIILMGIIVIIILSPVLSPSGGKKRKGKKVKVEEEVEVEE